MPRASRARDFTAVVARNLRVFFFFGKDQSTTETPRHGERLILIWFLPAQAFLRVDSVSQCLRGGIWFWLWYEYAVIICTNLPRIYG